MLARSTRLPNCSGDVSCPLTTTVAETPCPGVFGRSPIAPAETCAFCARMAAFTSAADKLNATILAGSSQMRIARSVPNSCAWPTPGMRWISGSTLREAKSPRATGSHAGSSDERIVNSRKFERALSTRTPCCVTAAGRRGAARERRFCTSTCARSGLVPDSNDSVIAPLPLACVTDSM